MFRQTASSPTIRVEFARALRAARQLGASDVDGRALSPRPARGARPPAARSACARSATRARGRTHERPCRFARRPAFPPGRRSSASPSPASTWRRRSRCCAASSPSSRFTKVGFLNAHNANVACAEPQFAEALRRFPHPARRDRRRYRGQAALRRDLPGQPQRHGFHPGLPQRRAAAADDRACSAPSGPMPRPQPRNSTQIAPQHNFVVVHDGYFSAAEEPLILRAHRGAAARRPAGCHGRAAPGILDRQEHHARPLHVPMAVGALLDFMSGAVPRAPLMHAPPAPRMAVPADHRARPAVAPLYLRQPGLPGARAAPEDHARRRRGSRQ